MAKETQNSEELDFSDISDCFVGYSLKMEPGHREQSEQILNRYVLKRLTFEEFISPYAYNADTYEKVLGSLEVALDTQIRNQDSVTDGKRPIMLDVLANATLIREALHNSIDLVKNTYINDS